MIEVLIADYEEENCQLEVGMLIEISWRDTRIASASAPNRGREFREHYPRETWNESNFFSDLVRI